MRWCAERDSNPRPTVCKTAERVGRVRRGGKLLLFWPAAGLVGEDWWGEGSRAERNGLVVSHAVFGEVGDEDEVVGYREGGREPSAGVGRARKSRSRRERGCGLRESGALSFWRTRCRWRRRQGRICRSICLWRRRSSGRRCTCGRGCRRRRRRRSCLWGRRSWRRRACWLRGRGRRGYGSCDCWLV